MNHFASYWQFFDKRDEALFLTGWRIRAKNRLADAAKGDVLWLFTSGDKLGNWYLIPRSSRFEETP